MRRRSTFFPRARGAFGRSVGRTINCSGATTVPSRPRARARACVCPSVASPPPRSPLFSAIHGSRFGEYLRQTGNGRGRAGGGRSGTWRDWLRPNYGSRLFLAPEHDRPTDRPTDDVANLRTRQSGPLPLCGARAASLLLQLAAGSRARCNRTPVFLPSFLPSRWAGPGSVHLDFTTLDCGSQLLAPPSAMRVRSGRAYFPSVDFCSTLLHSCSCVCASYIHGQSSIEDLYSVGLTGP